MPKRKLGTVTSKSNKKSANSSLNPSEGYTSRDSLSSNTPSPTPDQNQVALATNLIEINRLLTNLTQEFIDYYRAMQLQIFALGHADILQSRLNKTFNIVKQYRDLSINITGMSIGKLTEFANDIESKLVKHAHLSHKNHNVPGTSCTIRGIYEYNVDLAEALRNRVRLLDESDDRQLLADLQRPPSPVSQPNDSQMETEAETPSTPKNHRDLMHANIENTPPGCRFFNLGDKAELLNDLKHHLI